MRHPESNISQQRGWKLPSGLLVLFLTGTSAPRERACREAVWLEHRLLLAAREDMNAIADAILKIYECRQEFVGQPSPTSG